MGQLHSITGDLAQLGYQIIAISADRPEKLQESVEARDLEYVLLSDNTMDAASAFGIAFKLTDEQVAGLERYGIDIEEASGRTHHVLPVPSAFVVGTDGKIKYEYVNPSYQVRIDADLLLAEAKAALEGP